MCVRRNCFPFSALPYPLIFSISVSICCILNNFFICLLVHKFSLELLITCLTHPLIFFFKFLESCFAFQSYLIKLAALTPTLFYFCKHFQHAYFSSSDKHLMSLEAWFFRFMSLTYKELFLSWEKKNFPFLFIFFNWSTVDLTLVLIDVSGCAFATYTCVCPVASESLQPRGL